MSNREFQGRYHSRGHGPVPIAPEDDTHLLDLPELNLGSTATVARPQLAGAANGFPVRLLDLSCQGRNGRVVSIVMGQTITAPEPLPVGRTAIVTGPVTGIIEFGSGAALARVEFDLPPPSRIPFNPDWAGVAGVYRQYASEWRSGLTISVPGSSVRVLARNDNNLPVLTTPATIQGVSNVDDLDPTVFACAAYDAVFGGNRRSLRKTVRVGALTSQDTTANYCPIGIPAFAKAVTFSRQVMATTSFAATFYDPAGAVVAWYNVAANQWGPYDVPPQANAVAIENTGGVNMTSLALCFDLCI